MCGVTATSVPASTRATHVLMIMGAEARGPTAAPEAARMYSRCRVICLMGAIDGCSARSEGIGVRDPSLAASAGR